MVGLNYWNEENLSVEELERVLSTGRVIDGSYLVVSVISPDVIRIWSDPLGTVPGYYGIANDIIAIGVNALEVARSIGDHLDEKACRVYALFDYTPQPRTIFAHVLRVPPGSVVDIGIQTGQVNVRGYFNLPNAVAERATALKRTKNSIDEVVHEAWLCSVKKVLHSTPPSSRIGISLSGGLDSRYLMCAVKEAGFTCNCYTYCSSSSASDAALSRKSAECLGMPWQYLPITYDSSQMASFIARYGSMEPPFMSFLPQIAERLRNEIDVILVAAGGDVIWGSHTSLKQAARAFKAYLVWKGRCVSQRAAWVAASEVGDVSWATSLRTWSATLDDIASIFDDATREWHVNPFLAERFWSVCYRQPSYTWNSNLVYSDLGINVLCPTLSLDSVLTGLALPTGASWAGRAYCRSLVRFYPTVADVPVTRTRVSPRTGFIGAELAGLLLPLKRLIGLDWYTPWVKVTDWLPAWNQVSSEFACPDGERMSDERVPASIKVRLNVVKYVSVLLDRGVSVARQDVG